MNAAVGSFTQKCRCESSKPDIPFRAERKLLMLISILVVTETFDDLSGEKIPGSGKQ